MSNNNNSNKTTETNQACVKPFCVKTEYFTKEQIIEIHHLAVEAGAFNRESPIGASGDKIGLLTYQHDGFNFFGVDDENRTYFHNFANKFSYNIIKSMCGVYQHLGIKQEKTDMKNSAINQQTKQIKPSNKGPKILPKTSNLLVFVYNESTYTVRGVTNYEIVHEAPSLFLKYDFHRVNQSGHVQGSDKVKILGDLEKIVFKVPSDHNPNVYKQKIVLNLKG